METPIKPQLIITADDCGLSEGINDTTYQLHMDGIVTTATVMMNFPATQHALDMVASTPTLCAGVHLNLTDGFPLSNISPDSGLVFADGRFQPRTLLYTRALFSAPQWQEAVQQEMTAQIETYMQLSGKTPEHLTTHMHFHVVPSLRNMVLDLATQYNIPWIRVFQGSSTVIPFNFWVQEPDELFHPDNLRITPDYLTSIQAWLLQEPKTLIATLAKLNGVTEIVVHPDVDPDDSYPVDMKHTPEERAREHDYILRLHELIVTSDNAFNVADPARVLAS